MWSHSPLVKFSVKPVYGKRASLAKLAKQLAWPKVNNMKTVSQLLVNNELTDKTVDDWSIIWFIYQAKKH